MIQLVIALVLAFVVGAGATTGAMLMQHKALAAALPKAAAHDSAHAGADSARAAAAHEASAGPHATAAPGVPAAPPTGAHAAPEAHAAAPTAAAKGPAAAPPAPAALAKLAQPRPDYRKLAKIFATMKAADAVKVLALLSDDEIEGVMRELGAKQTADLLNAFPQERAAVLSRRLLIDGQASS